MDEVVVLVGFMFVELVVLDVVVEVGLLLGGFVVMGINVWVVVEVLGVVFFIFCWDESGVCLRFVLMLVGVFVIDDFGLCIGMNV